MKILVTGAEGFIGKNLVAELRNSGEYELYLCTKETSKEQLDNFTRDCDFVFHLAGINRPIKEDEFMIGNHNFTLNLLNSLKKNSNSSPILLTSSVQAKLSNPYGLSKKAGEKLLRDYHEETGFPIYIYRLPNVFGKWARPNYNSVVATFCYNIANDFEIRVDEPNKELTLSYIDDVITEFLLTLRGEAKIVDKFCDVQVKYSVKLGDLANLIKSFKKIRENLMIPDMSSEITKKLYSTYLSYLPEKNFSYPLKMNIDNRGSFTEFIRTPGRGQVSVNISKPGVTKGEHWHHTKNEKFLVVSGTGVIRLRRIDSSKIIEFFVSGERLEVIDIPVGYTHNIENLGKVDMVTIMWVNECFDPLKPDTYYMEVE